jgi:hypothetical protein
VQEVGEGDEVVVVVVADVQEFVEWDNVAAVAVVVAVVVVAVVDVVVVVVGGRGQGGGAVAGSLRSSVGAAWLVSPSPRLAGPKWAGLSQPVKLYANLRDRGHSSSVMARPSTRDLQWCSMRSIVSASTIPPMAFRMLLVSRVEVMPQIMSRFIW